MRKLDKHFPGMKEKYTRTYGTVYELSSPNAKKLIEVVRLNRSAVQENVQGQRDSFESGRMLCVSE